MFFKATIIKVGINPLVNVPQDALETIFVKAGKTKGPIPVKGKLNGISYIQTLVKFKGKWRLYLNTPMRKATGLDVGNLAKVKIEFDAATRITALHPQFAMLLTKSKKADEAFKKLPPYRQKEIMRYFNSLKTETAVKNNLNKALFHLEKGGVFAGRKTLKTTTK